MSRFSGGDPRRGQFDWQNLDRKPGLDFSFYKGLAFAFAFMAAVLAVFAWAMGWIG